MGNRIHKFLKLGEYTKISISIVMYYLVNLSKSLIKNKILLVKELFIINVKAAFKP